VTSLSVDSVSLSGVLVEISVDVLNDIQTNGSAENGGGTDGASGLTFGRVDSNNRSSSHVDVLARGEKN